MSEALFLSPPVVDCFDAYSEWESMFAVKIALMMMVLSDLLPRHVTMVIDTLLIDQLKGTNPQSKSLQDV